MKRAVAIGWLILAGATALFLVIGWLVIRPPDESFWQIARAVSIDIGLMAPAVRYLRNHPRPIREPRKPIRSEGELP